tara:strand:- start:147 stop:419 length:273 start_codon:yes stop_codon:yes gene_type:complete
MEQTSPYREIKMKSATLRVFDQEIEEEDLVWHRDRKKRKIEVLESGNWKLQLDNNRPILLEKGMTYTIPKMVYHRVIKGQYDLVLRIQDV